VRLVQMEPVYGGQADTAAAVRCGGAAGLAQTAHPDAAVAAAELLADAEWDARAGAARALALCPRPHAEPVLRLKLRAGDAEPAVVGEVLRALLALAPDAALPLAAARLGDNDEGVAEQAALALGDSRLEGALPALIEFCEATPLLSRRRAAMLAVALVRSDAARDWLLARVADADAKTAIVAGQALAIHRHDERLRERVLAAARARDEAEILREIAKAMAT
jgi:HEAT repeat protein